MSLPPLTPVPPVDIRLNIAPEEWESCLQAWISLTDLYLRLPAKELFVSAIKSSSLVQFLSSFYNEVAASSSQDSAFAGPRSPELRRRCFLLARRIYLETNESTPLFSFDFLANFCHVHRRSAALSRLLSELWRRNRQKLQESMQQKKVVVVEKLEGSQSHRSQHDLTQVSHVMLASPDAAAQFMTGSDFLDALGVAYEKSGVSHERKSIVATTYLGLYGLVKNEPPNLSLLTDHLYSLQARADRKNTSPSLIADLVTNTPLLSKLTRSTASNSAERLAKLLDKLETYRSPSVVKPQNRTLRKPDKGKGRSIVASEEMHMHRMSLVTQIQDLFPNLGSGFVLKLLDEYDDDVEQATAHLLDDSLPPHLATLDRTEKAQAIDTKLDSEVDDLAPRSTPPLEPTFMPTRRNVFDDDDFDRLAVDASRMHIGKKEDQTSSSQPNKAAILSALAAFDSDDDERDDTYDVEDVGGTVDTAHPDGEPGPAAQVTQEESDVALFTTYKTSPELFGRSFNIRRGQARQALKSETGLTDEAIEGWAIMLQRDPKRLKRLEAQFGSFDGNQATLARTAYRDSPAGTETEDSDVPAERGGFRGRGRGRGRGGRGGNVAGASGDASTAAAQRRKETNKGSRANHNRRDQRAKKMARGGFAG